MTPIPTLTTSRLTLRPFTQADAPDLHQLLSGKDVLRYFPSPTPPALASVERLITGQLKHWNKHGYGWWAVAINGALAGWCGLTYLPDTDETEVAYLLGRDYWGQGYATEAGRRSLAFAYEALAVNTIVGIVHPDNHASGRVLEKLGMTFTNDAEYFGMTVRRYAITRKMYEQSSLAQ